MFKCFITCMLSDYQHKLISGLVKRGFEVKSLAADTIALERQDEDVACVIGLRLSKKDVSVESCRDIIKQILMDNNYKYYSIVCCENAVNSAWNSSNIILPVKKKPIKSTAPHLTLIKERGPFAKDEE